MNDKYDSSHSNCDTSYSIDINDLCIHSGKESLTVGDLLTILIINNIPNEYSIRIKYKDFDNVFTIIDDIYKLYYIENSHSKRIYFHHKKQLNHTGLHEYFTFTYLI